MSEALATRVWPLDSKNFKNVSRISLENMNVVYATKINVLQDLSTLRSLDMGEIGCYAPILYRGEGYFGKRLKDYQWQ